LAVQYTDDGAGMGPTVKYGNGLRNTENRIKGIGGQITFDPMPTKGSKILLIMPIEYDSHD
jgi:signal transduction histidine kinase